MVLARSLLVAFLANWLINWFVLTPVETFHPAVTLWPMGYIVLAVVWLASGISVTADELLGQDQLEGVVLADDVVVRKGNSEGFEPQFEEALYQGVEFRLLEQRPGWLHIELANGKTGWIRADQAGLLG